MIQRFVQMLLALFGVKKSSSTASPKVEPIGEPISPLPEPETNWTDWTKKAIQIVMKFEGGNWANITGNFDGCGLTCGALGFTLLFGDQQRLVKLFLMRHGAGQLVKLMPTVGLEYIEICGLSNKEAVSRVRTWSVGANVLSPYLNELTAFWTSPEMVRIQSEDGALPMAEFAKQMTFKIQSHLGNPKPKFAHFAFWFDQAVLNGTGKLAEFESAEMIPLREVEQFCLTEFGAGEKDLRKNADLWFGWPMTEEKQFLVKLAYFRARRSRDDFDTDVMNRRGTLAVGKGWVHGEFMNFPWG